MATIKTVYLSIVVRFPCENSGEMSTTPAPSLKVHLQGYKAFVTHVTPSESWKEARNSRTTSTIVIFPPEVNDAIQGERDSESRNKLNCNSKQAPRYCIIHPRDDAMLVSSWSLLDPEHVHLLRLLKGLAWLLTMGLQLAIDHKHNAILCLFILL